MEYELCDEHEIPSGVRFDTPRRHQGQIILIAYGGFGREPMDYGDPYMRVTDQSEPSGQQTTYYKLKRSEP